MHVEDAIAKGGKLPVGGKRHALGGTYFEPTVIANASDDMLVACEETFGPLSALFRFRDEQEAVGAANATAFGLVA